MFVKKRRLTLITLLVLSIIMCISGVANTARQPVDTSSFTPEQLEAYNRFIAQPPGWLDMLADEFGLQKSDLIPLYNAGMSFGDIRNYLLELYPYEKIHATNTEFVALANETGISNFDAVKAYELAYKWHKDPVWIADLFKRTGNWDVIRTAFENWSESGKNLNEVKKISNGRLSKSESSFQLSRMHNVNSSEVQMLLDAGASEDDVRNILFFVEIESANSFGDDMSETRDLFSSKSLVQSVPLSIGISQASMLDEDWLDELPEEVNYLTEEWPKREFPEKLLPIPIPQSLQSQSRSLPQPSTSLEIEMPKFQIQPESEDTTYSASTASADIPNMVDKDSIFGVDKVSPFNSYFTGSIEEINPETGSLLIGQTDFTLPGKYGMDFTFARIFDSTNSLLEMPAISVEILGYFVSSGWTSGTYVGGDDVNDVDNFRQVEITDWTFSYDSQYTDDGLVSGRYCFETTGHLYMPGEMTSYADILVDDGCYTTTDYPYSGDISDEPDIEVDTWKEPMKSKGNIFGLGEGWSIDGIPVVYIEGNVNYIQLGSQGTYKVKSDGYLDRRDSKDLKFITNTGYTYSGVTSKYALTNVNGTVWYFNSSGSPIACKDKYGQYIRILYNSAGKIDKIIDTVGRVIAFTHSNNLVTVNVYESESSAISLQTFTYELSPFSVYGKNKLTKVNMPEGQSVQYTYQENTIAYEFEDYNESINIGYFTLNTVFNPTGGTTNFVYTVNDKNEIKVAERYDSVPTTIVSSTGTVPQTNIENKATFVYTPYNSTTKRYVTTKTMVRQTGETGLSPATEVWEYDNYHRIVKHKVVGENSGDDRQKTETIETTYEYANDIAKRPLNTKVKTTLSGSSESSEEVSKSIWDDYGNVIAFVNSNGRRTDYTYDPTYNMLIEEMTYVTDNEGMRTVYTLDADKKKVVSSETSYANKAKNGNTVKHYLPFISVQKNPNTHIWSSTTEIQSLYLILRWSTGGWWGDSRYDIDYRKAGNTNWSVGYGSPRREGGLISTIETDYVTINLPESDYYDIRVYNYVDKNGYVQVMDGSYALEPLYSWVNVGDSVYQTYEYDTNNPGNIVAVNTYPLGVKTGVPETRITYVYDTLWNAYPVESSTQVTKADGSISTVKSTVTYDKLGRPVSVRDEEVGVISSETQYQYDGLGRVIKVINPPHSSNTTGSEQNATYMDSLRQVQITDELGNVTRQTYDGLGRTSYTEWKDTSNVWHIAGHSRYDSLGRLVSSFDANFNETKYEYDAFGRQVKIIAPDNSQVQNWYVGVNLPISSNPTLSLTPPTGFATPQLSGWNKVEDADGNVGYQGYDILGRLVWTAVNPKTSPEAGVPSWDMTWYEYDKFDRVTKKAVNRTSTTWDITTYGYEYNNKPTVFTSPLTVDLPGDTEPMTVYEYNSRGLKVKEYPVTNPSQAVTIEYDELGNTKRITYPSQQEYINTGNTFMPTTSNVTRRDEFYYGIYGITRADSYANNMLENRYQASYNQRGWKMSESWNVDNTDYTFSYGYDAAGNKTSMTYPDNTTNTYIYDELSRMIRIPGYFERANGQSGFAYDPVGNMTDMWSTNGIHTQFTYNTRNMATGIISTPLSLAYTYSGNGNIVKITDTTGATPVELNYTYDAKGQLKTAQVNKPTGIETVSYSYDGTSNRISETWKNNQNQILSQYTYTYQPGDYLVSKTDPSSVVNYTWDIYGQLSSKSSGENYIFTGKRNLNTVTESNTVKELYTYDALGRRLKVQNADTTTLNFPLGNDTSYEVKKEGTDTTVTKYISANGKYLAKTVKVNTNPEQKYFHHIDLVGSIRAITDATGAVTASYEYEPFGVTIKTTGTDQDNLGFAGKRLDAGSGLSYFGARYYDSEMGRFISRDPAQDGRNWFVYCANNPLIYIDPNGMKILMDRIGYTDRTVYNAIRDFESWNEFYKKTVKSNEENALRVEKIHKTAMENSPIFRDIYEYLDLSKERLYIRVSNINKNKFYKPYEEPEYSKYPNISYNFPETSHIDFTFKNYVWVYVEEMCHAYEYFIGGKSLSMNQLDLELYVYNEYIEPILKQIDPNMYNWDDPNHRVYLLDEKYYNKYGEVVK